MISFETFFYLLFLLLYLHNSQCDSYIAYINKDTFIMLHYSA